MMVKITLSFWDSGNEVAHGSHMTRARGVMWPDEVTGSDDCLKVGLDTDSGGRSTLSFYGLFQDDVYYTILNYNYAIMCSSL